MTKYLLLGNGFDLAHGLPTRWKDYREYLKKDIENNSGNYTKSFSDIINKLLIDLDGDEFWNDVEAYLGQIGEKTSIEDYSTFVDFINEFTLNFQRYLIKMENERFPLIKVNSNLKDELNTIDKIYTTNYTRTLEKVYGVNKNKIVHLHGELLEYSDKVVTCIIGCDCSTNSFSKIPANANHYVENEILETNPHTNSKTGISKRDQITRRFGTTQYTKEVAKNYQMHLKNLRQDVNNCFRCKNNNVANGYLNIFYTCGFSFGKSDKVINGIVLEGFKGRSMYQKEIHKPNVKVYTHEQDYGMPPPEIQELVYKTWGFSTSEGDQVIKFVAEYIEALIIE